MAKVVKGSAKVYRVILGYAGIYQNIMKLSSDLTMTQLKKEDIILNVRRYIVKLYFFLNSN